MKKFKNCTIFVDTLKIKDLPFYWRVGNTKKVPKIPSNMDFKLYFDKEYNCLRQFVSPYLSQSLVEVYKQNENIGYLRQDNTLARKYHDDFLDFILQNIGDISHKKILEIGCGGCTILNVLKNKNAYVTGLDPSPFAKESASKFKIKIIDKFFKKELIDQNYDLTFFSDVLEHIVNPIEFLKDIASVLEPESKVIVAVPDASNEQDNGDISLCIHQHITYFNEESLKIIFYKSGLKPLKVIKSGYGGSLYALGEVPHKSEIIKIKKRPLFANENNTEYFKKVELVINKFNNIFNKALSKDILFHCYCPLRALPYLSAIGQLSNSRIRFIDDTPYWNNGFFDGSGIIINSLNDSNISMNDFIFIFLNTFENKIKEKLLNNGFKIDNIFSLANLYTLD